MAKVILVQGLSYGDEGKGTTIDYLARREKASLVVRFNGGAQAAHNVVTRKLSHTFSQFGSGTLAGARTYLSQYMIVNPYSLLNEAEHLPVKISDVMYVHENALVTTPYHIAANRLKELLRGPVNHHGSCGMGIGETVEDALERRPTIRIKDLKNKVGLRVLINSVRDRKFQFLESRAKQLIKERPELTELVELELDRLDSLADLDRYENFYSQVNVVTHDFLHQELLKEGCVLFEGAQGVLIDQDYGFQPYTTWSRCTWKNADDLLVEFDGERQYLGVIRTYMTRHGAGPFVTEEKNTQLEQLVQSKDHNQTNQWQESFRCGYFDPIALRYSIGVLGKIDGLVVTHMDTLERIGKEFLKIDRNVGVCDRYEWEEDHAPYAGEGLFTVKYSNSKRIDVPLELPSYERQARVAYYLDKAHPRYADTQMGVDNAVSIIEQELGVGHKQIPVVITSWGPTAEDKQDG